MKFRGFTVLVLVLLTAFSAHGQPPDPEQVTLDPIEQKPPQDTTLGPDLLLYGFPDLKTLYTGRIPDGVTAKEIFLGSWAPLSGPAAPWAGTIDGIGTCLQMINAQGGIHGRSLRLLYFDSAGDPKQTLIGVKKIVEEYGVLAFVGGVGAEPGLAVIDYLNNQGIPWVAPAAGEARFFTPPRPNVFCVWPAYQSEAAALARYAVQVLGLGRMALVFQNDAYGQAGRSGASAQLARHGLVFSAELPFPQDPKDLAEPMAQWKKRDIQAVLLWVNPTQAVQVRQAAKTAEFVPYWFTGTALSDSGVMNKVTGGLWEGTVFTSAAELPDEKSRPMSEAREAYEQFGPPGARWGPFFYGGLGLAEPMVQALKDCGPETTRKNLVQALVTLKGFKGVLGRISFGPQKRLGQEEIFLAQALKGGRTRKVSGWFSVWIP